MVVCTNLLDGLQQAGLLSTDWRFASGNFALVEESIEIFSLSRAWAAGLFAGVVAAELAAAVLFWRAFSTAQRPCIVQAFALGLALFSAFLIADEIFIVYAKLPGVAATHFRVLCALLLSLLVVLRLGDEL